jgi:hypothetical protein
MFPDQTVNNWVDRKFIATGMDTELEGIRECSRLDLFQTG